MYLLTPDNENLVCVGVGGEMANRIRTARHFRELNGNVSYSLKKRRPAIGR
jgi:hypothetical protein